MKRPLLELALILAIVLAASWLISELGPEVADKPATEAADSAHVLLFGVEPAQVYYLFADSLCLGLVHSWYRNSLELTVPDGYSQLAFVPFGDTVVSGIQASGNFATQGKSVVLFPNPSNGRAVDYYSDDLTWIRFYSVEGKLVHNQLLQYGWGTITFTDPLASGVYFWKRGNGDVTGSIVVVK